MRHRPRFPSTHFDQDISTHNPLSKKTQPAQLPSIKQGNSYPDLYNISYNISQNYIKIKQHTHALSTPSSARSSVGRPLQRKHRYGYEQVMGVPIEDRIQQKVEENQQRYQRIMSYVQWKSKEINIRKSREVAKFINQRKTQRTQL